ncbi:hypothetical protein BB561_002646 [Smittium simulii]|uniref:Uncharacterized protein n=1 Tax=Smittium simulii TaxID=133385 RepID=A0A2T9YPK9_9FUNG|nr:hypothetical protein BB561_002646 [Smittium simulii]
MMLKKFGCISLFLVLFEFGNTASGNSLALEINELNNASEKYTPSKMDVGQDNLQQSNEFSGILTRIKTGLSETSSILKRNYNRYHKKRRFRRLGRFHGPRRLEFNSFIEQNTRVCRFPWSIDNFENIYAITPDKENSGWAMSPHQQCMRGTWCPYACKPGYYSAQWDPDAVSANGKGSTNGGLYCDEDGILQVPFPERPFCARGMGNVVVNNTLANPVSACQTVYPGNEAMIIPSTAHPRGSVDLNVVPKSYWLSTSCQFYVNPAGSTNNECIWGNSKQPLGNWGPYIFGTGQAADGHTYISVRYNPLYIQSGFSLKNTYNVKIACVAGFCNFPANNECKCENGACTLPNGCTVTLTNDAKAQFVLY